MDAGPDPYAGRKELTFEAEGVEPLPTQLVVLRKRLIGLIRRECVDAPLPYASLLPYAGSEVDRSSKGCGAQYGTRDQRRYDITDNSFVEAQLNGTRARRKMPPSTATRSPSRERRPAPVTR
jgi:hypothetical protein